jgi:hypothetical protein
MLGVATTLFFSLMNVQEEMAMFLVSFWTCDLDVA